MLAAPMGIECVELDPIAGSLLHVDLVPTCLKWAEAPGSMKIQYLSRPIKRELTSPHTERMYH
jgi:hypothetical protein